jgi:hypothetical protein
MQNRLFVNVYLVSRVYGGPEEGGWWYDSGEPLASVPVPANREKGQTYFCSQASGVTSATCGSCEGTGETEEEDESTGETFRATCSYCGLVPADPAYAATVMATQREAFEDEQGRYQEIYVALERHFACVWPETCPRYE